MRNTLNYINGGRRCFGCGACAAACPTGALRMTGDDEGFAYPCIDPASCVKCGKCRRVCLVNASDGSAAGEPLCYSVRHRDRDIRKASTSGGAFTALSDAVLAHGGVVAGAVWTDNLEVHHVIAEDAEGRNAMRGSKYVQSDSGGVFADVKRLLDCGREVLFSGCPCQVAALYAFLGKHPVSLTTVDFICHGVPSSKVFHDYLRELGEKRNATAIRVRCRDESQGFLPECIGIDFADGTTYLEDCEHDLYFKLFLSGIIKRPCCAECPFTRVRRGSDLTISDNWHFAEFIPEWDDNTGVSTLLVNTPHGVELLSRAETALDVRKCTLQDIDQRSLHSPGGRHPDRELFFRAWKKRGFTAAATDFTRPRPFYRRVRSRLLKILEALSKLAGKAP